MINRRVGGLTIVEDALARGRPFAWVRRVGIGERIVKTALAAGIAWELSLLVPDNHLPYFAPLTAALVVQATIAQTISYATQRGIGVVLGIVVAVVLHGAVGVSGWSIALLVLVALTIGVRLRLGPVGVQQVAISALLVMLLSGPTDETTYALYRIADTIVGTAVALTVNALLAPPNYVPRAENAVRMLAERLAHVLDDIAAGLAEGMTPERATANLNEVRAVATSLQQSNATLKQAAESLRFNPLAGRRRARLPVLIHVDGTLNRAAIQVRVIARVISEVVAGDFASSSTTWLAPDALGRPYAALLSANAEVMRAFHTLLATGESGPFVARLAEERVRRAEVDAAARAQIAANPPSNWALIGEVLAVAHRLVGDVEAAAGELDVRTKAEIAPN